MNQEITSQQEATTVEAKQILASKQDVLREIGQIEAFEFINKLATVATLKLLAKAKETKDYVGLTYESENGDLATVANWEGFCTEILHTPKRTIDDRLLNLNTFGEEFFEASQRIGLGNRELRKLRQLPSETQELIINNESVDLGDKEAVKELIEDFTFKQVTEKAELQKQVDEANEDVAAAREISAETQQKLNQAKELEAKRRFSQEPWKHQTMDSAAAMMKAKMAIEQGINQLSDVYSNLSNDEALDEKALALIARSLLTEAHAAHSRINEFSNEVFGVLGSKYSPDISAEDTFFDLQFEGTPEEQSLVG